MNETMTNEVMVTLLDAKQARHDTLSTTLADVVLAALTAEPETLDELETAIARYNQPISRAGFLEHMNAGLNVSRWDAGLLLIDLPARLVVAVTEPALYDPQPLGLALFCSDPLPDLADAAEEELCWLRFRLSSDWLFVNSLASWRMLAAERRRTRAAQLQFDARPVLFGQLPGFIAHACLTARQAKEPDPVIAIHERWLLTPQAALHQQTPRSILLARREAIEDDLESRCRQWSFTGVCPPGLSPDSRHYRYAGFGTHSNVVYYELTRYLIYECWERVRNDQTVQLADETARLERLQSIWLAEGGDYPCSPGWILEQERRRIPLTLSGAEAVLDPDCPLCELNANPEFGPSFWHLDGSGMDLDDNWVFSFHPTQAEWDAERREWEERSRKFNEDWHQRQAEIAWADGETIHDDRKVAGENDEEEIVPF
jgi:hypothetical protein